MVMQNFPQYFERVEPMFKPGDKVLVTDGSWSVEIEGGLMVNAAAAYGYKDGKGTVWTVVKVGTPMPSFIEGDEGNTYGAEQRRMNNDIALTDGERTVYARQCRCEKHEEKFEIAGKEYTRAELVGKRVFIMGCYPYVVDIKNITCGTITGMFTSVLSKKNSPDRQIGQHELNNGTFYIKDITDLTVIQ